MDMRRRSVLGIGVVGGLALAAAAHATETPVSSFELEGEAGK